MKKFNKIVLSLSAIFVLLIGGIVTASAQDEYNLTRHQNVKTSVGTIKTMCQGTYYYTGNTRWSRFWAVTDGMGLKSAGFSKSTMTIPDDRHMSTEGTFSATTFGHVSGTGSTTVAFRFNGSGVVAD